jgi:Family of unknown function (DUF6328)
MMLLKDKIENALNEGRILILGSQVLIGAGFRSVFADGFEKLPFDTQVLGIGSLWLTTIGLGILLLPAGYHFIVERGENTASFHRLITSILEWALLPFAIGLGVNAFMVGEKVSSTKVGGIAGVFLAMLAISLWYVFSSARKREVPTEAKKEPTKLTDRIKEALIEARMVLPGAQALLGFQVANTLTDSFDRLPRTSQWAHLASLMCVAVSTIFLIAPAAYHRIAEHGEDSEEFYNLSGRLLMSALFWLGLGISADLWIIARKISQSVIFSNLVSAGTLVFFYGFWFGYSAQKRRRKVHSVDVLNRRV